MRFVMGQDRSQSTLFPALLDDYIGDDNPVLAIDFFVDELAVLDARQLDGSAAILGPNGLPSGAQSHRRP
jgi:hypothetical protein